MKLTKYTHACIRLEKDNADGGSSVLVLDPGVFSETALALEGADAVVVTHEHGDHIDVDALAAALAADPALTVHAPAQAADNLRAAAGDAAGRVVDLAAGQDLELAGFALRTFGGQHALIHPLIPVVANVGVLVDGSVYHPGDSFAVPHGVDVRVLLVPIHAPWSKVSEVVDFVVSVRAPRAFQIHDGLLNETGLGFSESHVARIGAQYGTEFRHLAPGESVEV
jgi:L-ascorbate metabolism protein UlaG (beta-lactamase superfamily)